MVKRKRKAPVVSRTRYDVRELLERMERAGFTGITTRGGLVYFTDADGAPGAFPYTLVESKGADYLVAGPGTGSKLDGAYDAGTGIIGEYALVRMLGRYKAHPLVEEA
jgi:hypothetical protein